jgi:arylsulfatase A-like enzyme
VNIAALGAATLLIGLGALVVVRLVRCMGARDRADARDAASGLAPAAAMAGVILLTRGLGTCASVTATTSLAAATGACGALAVSRQRRGGCGPILTPGARIAIIAAWTLCVATAHAAYSKTRGAIEEWVGPEYTAPASASAGRTDVLLVVLDTLRRDRVGVYGDSRLTPKLDALATESIVYTNAFSTAPWTLPTHASLFTGLYPSQHGVSWGRFGLSERPATIAEMLKRRGYSTHAISNNCLLTAENGYDRGFDSFIELSYHPSVSRWKLALRCGVPARVAQWMGIDRDAATDQGAALSNWMLAKHVARNVVAGPPSFTFINYYEPHDPYEPPARFREALMSPELRRRAETYVQSRDALVTRGCAVHGAVPDEDLPLLRALYDADVAYQDERLGELIETYRRAGALDHTWVIVTSDHGELFGEQGRTYHSAGTHHNLLHVPLIVRPPGGVASRTVDAPVQPVDIFATLAGIAGVDLPPGVTGATPLPLTPDEPPRRDLCVSQTYGASLFALSISQRAEMSGDLTRWLTWMTSVYADGFMLDLDGATPRALYDVRVDPDAEHNLLDVRADIVRSMMTRYERWRQENPQGDRSG